MRRFILEPTTLCTGSTSAIFVPATAWSLSADIVLARVAEFEIAAVQGLATCAPAYQVANAEDSPGAIEVIDPNNTYRGSVDVYYASDFRNIRVDATAPLKSNQLVRFGWLVKLSSGSTLGFVVARAVIETTEN